MSPPISVNTTSVGDGRTVDVDRIFDNSVAIRSIFSICNALCKEVF